nr:hypothetical protein [Tanacetum cinerariifolium]
MCINCTYGDGKPITCCVCEGPLRAGFCLFCDSKAENSFTYDPNVYSFNDTSSNFNHLSQPRYETYLCELCVNDSHYGYDCQPQFPFVYEQEPSYNQNYNDNFYPHDLPSFPCCNNCGGSHETFQCQPMDQNIDSSGLDQIQNPQYPFIHPPSQEMKHSIQYKEYLENSSNEIAASNSNQEKEKQPQDSDIRQLIRKECCIKVCREQKKNMEDTMLELVEVCRKKEFYCMHNNVDDLIESALNYKLFSINLKSQRLDKKKQEVKNIVEQPTKRGTRIVESLQNFRVIHKKSSISLNNTYQISPVHAITPVLLTEELEYSLNMGYEHLSTIPEMESDEITESSVKILLPIPREYKVTSEDKRECDVPVCKDSSTFEVCEEHSEILSDPNDDDISSDDDAFEGIEYVEASPLDSEIVSLEEENVVYQEDEEFDLEDILQIQYVILREKLLSINRLIADIESLNDNTTPDRVLNSSTSIPIFEESDNSLSNNSLLEFKTFSDHTEDTRSGSTTAHDFFPEYDSFCFEIEPDQERLNSVVMNDISDDSTNDPLLEE